VQAESRICQPVARLGRDREFKHDRLDKCVGREAAKIKLVEGPGPKRVLDVARNDKRLAAVVVRRLDLEQRGVGGGTVGEGSRVGPADQTPECEPPNEFKSENQCSLILEQSPVCATGGLEQAGFTPDLGAVHTRGATGEQILTGIAVALNDPV